MNFIPATGSEVNNGVVTISLGINVEGRMWENVAERAYNKLNSMYGIDPAHYGVFVMPNSVNFEDALAYGYLGGIFTFFKSMAASIPVVQVHELGEHNMFWL